MGAASHSASEEAEHLADLRRSGVRRRVAGRVVREPALRAAVLRCDPQTRRAVARRLRLHAACQYCGTDTTAVRAGGAAYALGSLQVRQYALVANP